MKVVLVEWQDAESFDPWIAIDEAPQELTVIKSVGFLIRETKDILTLALNHDVEGEEISCVMNIPRAWIKKKTILLK